MNSSTEEDLIKEDLIKKLKLIDNVYSSKWVTVMEVVTILSKSKILEKNWENHKQDFEDIYPLNLEEIDTWSTFESCVSLCFSILEEGLICNAHIYDGTTTGERRALRFTAKIQLPLSFIVNLNDSIEYTFEDYLNDSYHLFLQNRKVEWKKEYKKRMGLL